MSAVHHRVVIVGGGNAGVSVASRLRHAGVDDVAVVEPSDRHFYQPLWTLVGGGRAPLSKSVRTESSVLPRGVAWLKDRAIAIDPDRRVLETAGGTRLSYDYLVMCPGIQLDWNAVPGMAEAVASPHASSNYQFDLAPKTWEKIRSLRSGSAVFTMPTGPIKCAGAPQKIAYLAADYWRRQGVLADIDITLVLPTPGMFGVKEFSDELEHVAQGYGIRVLFNSEVTAIDPESRRATISSSAGEEGTDEVGFDFLHAVPRQSAPDWLKATQLADPENPAGYVDVDKATLQHRRYPEIFALGDAGSTPNSKTGAAIRKQAPVVTANLMAAMQSQPLPAGYAGYASCPIPTARNKLLLCEFDYSMRPAPSFPVINTKRERRDMWFLKRYGLPFLYWHAFLPGRA